MLTLAVLSGLLTVVSVLFLLQRILPLKLLFGYASLFDVSFHLLMLAVFVGTLGGAITAVIAGLCLSMILTIGRYCFGYQKIRYLKRCGWIVIDYPAPLAKAVKEKFKWQSASL